MIKETRKKRHGRREGSGLERVGESAVLERFELKKSLEGGVPSTRKERCFLRRPGSSVRGTDHIIAFLMPVLTPSRQATLEILGCDCAARNMRPGGSHAPMYQVPRIASGAGVDAQLTGPTTRSRYKYIHPCAGPAASVGLIVAPAARPLLLRVRTRSFQPSTELSPRLF